MRNGPPAAEVCSLAANFMAMLGATRSSVSAVITSTGGYLDAGADVVVRGVREQDLELRLDPRHCRIRESRSGRP